MANRWNAGGCLCCADCTIISDDFSTDTIADYTVRTGMWAVSAGMLTNSNGTGIITATASETPASYQITVKGRVSVATDVLGIVWNYQDASNYWRLQVATQIPDMAGNECGTVSLIEKSGGVDTNHGPTAWVLSDMGASTWITFGICIESDGTAWCTVGSSSFPLEITLPGLNAVGVFCSGSGPTDFDDFTVSFAEDSKTHCVNCRSTCNIVNHDWSGFTGGATWSPGCDLTSTGTWVKGNAINGAKCTVGGTVISTLTATDSDYSVAASFEAIGSGDTATIYFDYVDASNNHRVDVTWVDASNWQMEVFASGSSIGSLTFPTPGLDAGFSDSTVTVRVCVRGSIISVVWSPYSPLDTVRQLDVSSTMLGGQKAGVGATAGVIFKQLRRQRLTEYNHVGEAYCPGCLGINGQCVGCTTFAGTDTTPKYWRTVVSGFSTSVVFTGLECADNTSPCEQHNGTFIKTARGHAGYGGACGTLYLPDNPRCTNAVSREFHKFLLRLEPIGVQSWQVFWDAEIQNPNGAVWKFVSQTVHNVTQTWNCYEFPQHTLTFTEKTDERDFTTGRCAHDGSTISIAPI